MPPKVLLTVVIGTILEYFDFLLFAHFGLIIAPLFFDEIDPIICALYGFSLLGIGFIMRPLGAIIFGKIADSKGRIQALSFSILWVTFPTFIISFLPGYKVIGIAAPLILISCRIAQGLSLGGEYTNAGVLLMELSPPEKRGFYSGILCASASLGGLCALSCAFLILYIDVPSWAWRLPFFISALLGFVGYKLRSILFKNEEFYKLKTNNILNKNDPQQEKISNNKIAFFIIVSLGALIGVLTWTGISYTNFYLTKILEWNATEAASMTFLTMITYAGTLPLIGKLGDRIGNAQSIMLYTAILTIFSSYPLLFCLTHGLPIVTQIGFGLLASFFGASVHAIMSDLYPKPKRCQKISLGFSIGLGIGGATPTVEVWLSDSLNDFMIPAFYISLIAVIAAIATCLYPSVKKNNQSYNLSRNPI